LKRKFKHRLAMSDKPLITDEAIEYMKSVKENTNIFVKEKIGVVLNKDESLATGNHN
jgi:hypothetical protein